MQYFIESISLNQINKVALVVLFLPFLSAIAILFSHRLDIDKGKIASLFLLMACFLSVFLLINMEAGASFHSRFQWFTLLSGNQKISFTVGLITDRLTATMLLIVTFISFLVHLFSIEYMKGDKGYNRYFMFLGIFTFSMLGLVLADNLLIIFIFWELVGFSSFLLIGFWYQKSSASKAAKKAFIVNRIGDFGFLIGLLVLYSIFGTLDISTLQVQFKSLIIENNFIVLDKLSNHPELFDIKWISIAGLALFAGAVGKSAQFPLLVWLPDAMEGPTPVSALIHAATMVAAGVYLLARVFFMLNIDVLELIAYTGAITAFIAAYAAFSQNDIKKVLAFSTISQLGYMMIGIGVGAYDAALFHLMTHAFFKACLFLCSGAIIYSMHQLEHKLNDGGANVHWDAQDMRFMGGLRTRMPFTFAAYFISAMALAGLPFFSGFLSKDAILTGAMAWAKVSSASEGSFFGYFIPVLGFASAFMTAAYMARQIMLVFFGDFRLEKYNPIASGAFQKIKGVPILMKAPLLLLSALSLGIFYSTNFLNADSGWAKQSFKSATNDERFAGVFLEKGQDMLQAGIQYHSLVSYISVFLAFSGLVFSYFYFNPTGNFVAGYYRRFQPLSIFEKLSLNNWYLDKIYKTGIINPVMKLSKFCHSFDQKVVDGLVNFIGIANVYLAHILAWFDRTIVDGLVNLMAYISKIISRILSNAQNGHVQKYLIMLVTILLLLVIWIIL